MKHNCSDHVSDQNQTIRNRRIRLLYSLLYANLCPLPHIRLSSLRQTQPVFMVTVETRHVNTREVEVELSNTVTEFSNSELAQTFLLC